MEADFFIVGQGLAGTLLAFELISQKKKVIVFDELQNTKASDVAAGLINPVVFRRMTKTALLDAAFPQMESTYQQLEDLLDEKFYFPGQILKLLNEEGDLLWRNKVFANQLTDYISPNPIQPDQFEVLKSTYSIGLINKSGRIDLQNLIRSFRKFLIERNLIYFEPFDYEKVAISTEYVYYKGHSAQKIIFCEGAAASKNPFFSKIQFKHSKGEVLDVRLPNVNINETVADEVFLMPMGNDRFKVGATYSWEIQNCKTTEIGRSELLEKLKKITSVKPIVLNQLAGIRPTTHDRKPVVGLLPHCPQIGILNGLGSKGALLAPYCARLLSDVLTGNTTNIPGDINVTRYFKSI